MTDSFVACDLSANSVDFLPKSNEIIQDQDAVEISGGEFNTASDSSLISSDHVVDEDGSIVDVTLSFDGTEYTILKEALNTLTLRSHIMTLYEDVYSLSPSKMKCPSSWILMVMFWQISR